MAKRKKASRSASKSKFSYRAETYGVRFNSLTFLLFALFALVVAMLLVSSMLGINLY